MGEGGEKSPEDEGVGKKRLEVRQNGEWIAHGAAGLVVLQVVEGTKYCVLRCGS